MTEFVEGPIVEIRNWTNGKGGDVKIGQDNIDYYFDGKMDIPIGQACRLEVKDGEGEHSKKKEILSCNPLIENRAGGIPNMLPQPKAGPRMLNIPMQDFQTLMSQRMSLSECKVRSLENASKIYGSMSKIEKDPKAAAQEVVMIATILEGYLA